MKTLVVKVNWLLKLERRTRSWKKPITGFSMEKPALTVLESTLHRAANPGLWGKKIVSKISIRKSRWGAPLPVSGFPIDF